LSRKLQNTRERQFTYFEICGTKSSAVVILVAFLFWGAAYRQRRYKAKEKMKS
jgi:hypothetical protein